MKIDCQWIEQNMEAFFCERLSVEENTQVLRHLETCTGCRDAVAELRSVDPLIKQLFRRELAVARAPRRLRWSALVPAAAVTLAALVAIVVALGPPPKVSVPLMSSQPSASAVIATNPPELPAIPKASTDAGQERAKPEPIAPEDAMRPATAQPPADTVNSRLEFVVTDPAGYSRTLHDYRGHILIFGVWSGKQPKTVAAVERIYQTFGPNTKLRILGVANQRQPKPSIATFPIVYNQGSTLLGVKESEFAVVSEDGTVGFRGSLLQDPNAVVASIRSVLSKINP